MNQRVQNVKYGKVDELIARENHSKEMLRLKLTEIEGTVMNLRHVLKVFTTESQKPNKIDVSKHLNLMHGKIVQIAQIIKNQREKQQILNQHQIKNLNMKEQLLYEEFMNITHKWEQEVSAQMLSYLQFEQQHYRQAHEQKICQITKISQQLNKRGQSLQGGLTEGYLKKFISDLASRFQNILSKQHVDMFEIQHLDQLKTDLNTEILKLTNQIQQLKNLLLQQRNQYLAIDSQIQIIKGTYEQLRLLKEENERLNQEVAYLNKYNQNLNENMEKEANKTVKQKIKLINSENYKDANKYLLGCEYLLQNFKTVLPQNVRLELQKEFERCKRSTIQKLLKPIENV